LKQAPFNKRDAQLVPAAGSCVDCPKRTGHNKLLFADVSIALPRTRYIATEVRYICSARRAVENRAWPPAPTRCWLRNWYCARCDPDVIERFFSDLFSCSPRKRSSELFSIAKSEGSKLEGRRLPKPSSKNKDGPNYNTRIQKGGALLEEMRQLVRF
jgi:hypothetical protein